MAHRSRERSMPGDAALLLCLGHLSCLDVDKVGQQVRTVAINCVGLFPYRTEDIPEVTVYRMGGKEQVGFHRILRPYWQLEQNEELAVIFKQTDFQIHLHIDALTFSRSMRLTITCHFIGGFDHKKTAEICELQKLRYHIGRIQQRDRFMGHVGAIAQ